MAPSRRNSNGRSPLVNQQRQITSFFTKSPSPSLPKTHPKLNPSPIPDPNPTTPSPSIPKPRKPLLLIGASPSSTSPFRQEVVGKRIKVYWPLDDAWYEGFVKSFHKLTSKHLVQYDDGEEESVDLSKEKVEWPPQDGSSSKKKLKRLRRGSLDVRKMVIDDDDEVAEESLKEEDGGGDGDEEGGDDDDDSGDEDWGKNAVLEDAVDGEEEEEMELEDEDDVAERSKGKPRKRKLSAPEKVEPAKKSKSGAEVSKGAFKLSVLEPSNHSDSKRPFESCF